MENEHGSGVTAGRSFFTATSRRCHAEIERLDDMSNAPGAVVLLVQPRDDDEDERYVEVLRNHGLTPLAVSNARDAMAVAPKADIVVTGVLLPGSTDGVGLIAQLRRNEW